jgi:drug/metabolite transporter (DMT)-like permease
VRESPRNETLIPSIQFRIRHVLVATTLCAVLFALIRMPGRERTLSAVATILYTFAPAMAFAISRFGATTATRRSMAAAVLAVAMCLVFSIAAIFESHVLAEVIVVATILVWAPQIAFFYLIHAAWESGLRSAGLNPNAISGREHVSSPSLERNVRHGPGGND